MGSAQPDTFDQLQGRIRQLVERYVKEKGKNELLSREKSELEEQVRQEKEKLSDLQAKYQKLKISKTLIASSEDIHDAKLKVNRMVREIDKCIALLNR